MKRNLRVEYRPADENEIWIPRGRPKDAAEAARPPDQTETEAALGSGKVTENLWKIVFKIANVRWTIVPCDMAEATRGYWLTLMVSIIIWR